METFSALQALCAGISPVPGEFPAQRPVTRSFDVFFDLRPNKRLSKQSWGWWFETLSCSLWRHCNDYITVAVISSFFYRNNYITNIPCMDRLREKTMTRITNKGFLKSGGSVWNFLVTQCWQINDPNCQQLLHYLLPTFHPPQIERNWHRLFLIFIDTCKYFVIVLESNEF